MGIIGLNNIAINPITIACQFLFSFMEFTNRMIAAIKTTIRRKV